MSYLILASLLLLAVWPAYYLLLRYSDRYGINRWLLLAGMVAVCALPLAKLSSPVPQATAMLRNTVEYAVIQVVSSGEEVATAAPKPVPETNETMTTSGTSATAEAVPSAAPTSPRSWSWWTAYAIGFGIMLLLMGVRMLSVLTLHLRSRPNGDAAYRLLHPLANSGQAFTFGTALYFSIDVPDDPDFDQVLAHERVHARQFHTLDVLLSEVFLCLFWFHPAAWWMRSQLRANLEYLVDATVIWDGLNPRNYQLALVRQSQGAQSLALALPFSEPSLRSRISRLTGLPHHWAVATVASLGMAIWLAVAGLTIFGIAPGTSDYSDKEPYVAYFEDRLPEKINSFNIYARRAPTPDEYYQIRAILQRIPGARMYVYRPEFNDDELMLRIEMDGSHAELEFSLAETPSAVGTYRLGLSSAQPKHVAWQSSNAWITPMAESRFEGPTDVVMADIKNSSQLEYSDALFKDNGSMTISSRSYSSTPHDLHKNLLAKDEEFVVRVNGKIIPLSSSVTVKNDDTDFFLLDNGQLLAQDWGTDNLFPPNKTPIPIARMMRLMNCPNPEDCDMTYATVEYSGGTYRAVIDHSVFPEYQSYSAYLNGEIIDLSELLDTDYGPESYFHIGWNMDDDSPIVVEVVDGNYVDKTGLSEEVLREAFNAMYEASRPDEAVE